jgi:hypothetical protein
MGSIQGTVFKRSFTFDDSIVKKLTFGINGQPAFDGPLTVTEGEELRITGELEVTPESGLIQGGDGALKAIMGTLVCRPPGSRRWDTLEVEQRRDIIIAPQLTRKKGLVGLGGMSQAPPAGEYEMRLIVSFGKHPLSELTSYWLATGKLVVEPVQAGNP